MILSPAGLWVVCGAADDNQTVEALYLVPDMRHAIPVPIGFMSD